AGTEARAELDDLVRSNPGSLEVHLLSAQAYEYLKKLPEAVRELHTANTLNPGALFIRLNLARLDELTGDYEGLQDIISSLSEEDLKTFARGDQRNSPAQLLAQQGQPDRAINVLAPEGNTARDTVEALRLLAQLYERKGKPAEANNIIKQLLANNPDAKTQ